MFILQNSRPTCQFLEISEIFLPEIFTGIYIKNIPKLFLRETKFINIPWMILQNFKTPCQFMEISGLFLQEINTEI